MKHQELCPPPRYGVGLVVLIIIFISIVIIKLLPSGEPRYHDRTLTQWLDDRTKRQNPFLTHPAPLSAEAQQAIKSIGTNAVPILLEMVQAKDSAFKTRLNSALNRQRFIKFSSRPAVEQRAMAFAGFEILGENANSAAPALASLTADPDAGVRYTALESLRRVTSDKSVLVPVLLHACRDSAPEIRFVASTDLHFRSPESLRTAGIPDLLDEVFKQTTNNVFVRPPLTSN